jgi:hypothetical protein
VHEAVCAERSRQANARLGRIEAVLAAIMRLLLLGEGSVVDVVRRRREASASCLPARFLACLAGCADRF